MRLFYFLGISFAVFQASFAYDKTLYGAQKVGKPYQIGKKTYKPQEYTHLQQEGYISWYGPGFHAKQTANGAIFDKNTFTAAHKTLQLPSVDRVDVGQRSLGLKNFIFGQLILATRFEGSFNTTVGIAKSTGY